MCSKKLIGAVMMVRKLSSEIRIKRKGNWNNLATAGANYYVGGGGGGA